MTTAVAPAGPLDDAGKLLLRLTIGGLILFHGIAKLRRGLEPVAQAVVGAGLPSAMGYLAYVGEVIAPILMIIGLWTRPAALVVAIQMVFAIGLVHGAQLLAIADTGGWALELQGLYLFGAIAVALLGAGRYGVAGSGRWN